MQWSSGWTLSAMVVLVGAAGCTAEAPAPVQKARVEVELLNCELQDGRTTVRVQNDNDFALLVDLQVGYYDAAGTQLKTGTSSVTVQPQQSARETLPQERLYGRTGECRIESVEPRKA